MSSKIDVAVSVRNIHKEFILPQHKNTTFKQTLVNIVKKNKKVTQKVLDGVSFNVKRGDFFGIVGRNGSGKSTLLKLIAGVYTPTSGSIEINGGLTPFIELGVGFNPELSGRDNVYLNGALLGFNHKQMDKLYNEIVAFAELDPFMDQKLKNYSSGMQVRLAFSIAIKAKSEILIFDEVLAVGDEAFQRKCNDYFDKIRQDKNQTVILVTHSMDAVKRYCNRAILIKDGKIVAEGDPSDVANEYTLENVMDSRPQTKDNKQQNNSGVKNLKIKLLSKNQIDENGDIKFQLDYDLIKDITTVPALSITDINRNVWIQNDNMWHKTVKGIGHHKIVYSCKLPNYINNCVVKIQASVWSDEERILDYIDDSNAPKVVITRKNIKTKRDEGVATGLIHYKGDWDIVQ